MGNRAAVEVDPQAFARIGLAGGALDLEEHVDAVPGAGRCVRQAEGGDAAIDGGRTFAQRGARDPDCGQAGEQIGR